MSATRRFPSVLAVFAVGVCGCLAFDLLAAWRTSPMDRLGWLAFVIWLAPILMLRLWSDVESAIRESRSLLIASLVLGLAGLFGRVNVLQHAGLLLALVGLLPPRRESAAGFIAWAASGLSWMPALGWVAAGLGANSVLAGRLVLAGFGSAAVLAALRRRVGVAREKGPIDKANVSDRVLLVGLSMATVLALIYQFTPLTGAEDRLLRMPVSGPGFTSRSMPLRSEERAMLGDGMATRRLYRWQGRELVVSVIDGTLNRHAVHDPIYCLAGSGYAIARDERIQVNGGHARFLEVEKNGQHSEMVFWFSDGTSRHGSMLGYWWDTTCRRMTLGLTGPEPLLVIVQCDGNTSLKHSIQGCTPLFSM